VKPNRAWRTASVVPVPLHHKNLSGSIDYVHYLKKSNFGGIGIDVTNSAISAGVLYTFK